MAKGRITSIAEQFWSKVDGSAGASGCWWWTGAKSRGYGKLGRLENGRLVSLIAHRVSWAIHNGEIPDGMCVCHACDNPSCVNPAHLWLGTNADNTADKVSKGRQSRGEAHGRSARTAVPRRGNYVTKLTEEQVLAIRSEARRGNNRQLAARYGVSRYTLSDIVTRKSWKHI